MYDFFSLDRSLDTMAARRVQRLTQRGTWLSDRLALISSLPIVDAAYLRHLPAGTFGRTWIDTLNMDGLAPLFSGPGRQQLHDGIHVLTGYGTERLGEAHVQAFLVGTKFRLFHGVILGQIVLAVALVKPIARRVGQGDGFTVQILMEHLHQAYMRGSKSRLDPDCWQPEHLWHLPLAIVRTMFHV